MAATTILSNARKFRRGNLILNLRVGKRAHQLHCTAINTRGLSHGTFRFWCSREAKAQTDFYLAVGIMMAQPHLRNLGARSGPYAVRGIQCAVRSNAAPMTGIASSRAMKYG